MAPEVHATHAVVHACAGIHLCLAIMLSAVHTCLVNSTVVQPLDLPQVLCLLPTVLPLSSGSRPLTVDYTCLSPRQRAQRAGVNFCCCLESNRIGGVMCDVVAWSAI